jgi:hypothetical protein
MNKVARVATVVEMCPPPCLIRPPRKYTHTQTRGIILNKEM